MGINMDLDFNLLETGSLGFSIILTAFTLQVFIYSPPCWIVVLTRLRTLDSLKSRFFWFLQDGTSHYMKGIVLCLCYAIIGACFFVHRIVLGKCMHIYSSKFRNSIVQKLFLTEDGITRRFPSCTNNLFVFPIFSWQIKMLPWELWPLNRLLLYYWFPVNYFIIQCGMVIRSFN